MKFDIKQQTAEVLNTFRINIKMGHGDGDLYQDLNLGNFKEEDLSNVAGIIKAIEEMKKSDLKTNNAHLYDKCPNFRRFLKQHWKYDVFTKNSNYRYYAYVSDFAIFYIDENGIEYEIENIQYEVKPEPQYYYFKLESGLRFNTFFGEWDIIKTSEPLDNTTLKQWRLVELSNAEEFISKFSYQEVEIDTQELEEDREFLIVRHLEVFLKTEEQEDAFGNEVNELKKKAIFLSR